MKERRADRMETFNSIPASKVDTLEIGIGWLAFMDLDNNSVKA
jgi:hypothetical protein